VIVCIPSLHTKITKSFFTDEKLNEICLFKKNQTTEIIQNKVQDVHTKNKDRLISAAQLAGNLCT